MRLEGETEPWKVGAVSESARARTPKVGTKDPRDKGDEASSIAVEDGRRMDHLVTLRALGR